VRWNVEDFGYIYITADNGGDFYELPAPGKTLTLNLNYELAKSRIVRNRNRLGQLTGDWQPSRELRGHLDISEGYFEDASRASDEERKGSLAQRALLYAMRAGEMMELERARHEITRTGYRPDFFIGCDARSFFQMDPERFIELFTELFNYATITHYVV